MSTPDNKTKKLVLVRETIAPLEPEDLDKVAGGISIVTRGQSCCLFNSCNKTVAME